MELMACIPASEFSGDSCADTVDMSWPAMFMPFMSGEEFSCAKQNAAVRHNKIGGFFMIVWSSSSDDLLTLPQVDSFARSKFRRPDYFGLSRGSLPQGLFAGLTACTS